MRIDELLIYKQKAEYFGIKIIDFGKSIMDFGQSRKMIG